MGEILNKGVLVATARKQTVAVEDAGVIGADATLDACLGNTGVGGQWLT